jgi:[acyl-carrier-protein] S-malonyltransferase
VINNVDVDYETAPAAIKSSLIRQMTGAVRWSQFVKKLTDDGIERFIEFGPGNVLTGLIKKIDKFVECINISSLTDLEKI